MQEKAKEPEIRFAGFTGAWEQRKLGELYEKAGSGGTPNASNASFYSGTIPFLGISDIKGRYITKTAKHISEKGLKSSAAWMVPSGAISLAMYASVGKVGITTVELATSQAFYNMVFASSSLRNFIFSRLEKSSDNDEWLPLVSTGTQSNLNADKIKNWCISVPNPDEQKLVGDFFKTLDSLLTLHQRKYEKLLNIKKSMLEKMFPKEGEDVPEIRFKGFTGAWEQRKLGELYEKAGSGGTPNASNASFYSGTIPFLGISDIKGRYITKTAKHISEKGLKSSAAWMVPSGAISLAMYASVGKVGITTVELATSQAFYNMVFASSSLRNFIFSRLEKSSDNDEWLPLVSTGTQSNLNADKIKNWCISVPNPDEQKLVGDFFKTLDSLLTLHQRKLEMLKNVKQAFLEKMFV